MVAYGMKTPGLVALSAKWELRRTFLLASGLASTIKVLFNEYRYIILKSNPGPISNDTL